LETTSVAYSGEVNHRSDTCFKAGTEEDQENNIHMLHLFTDFKATCDSVRRNKVLLTMENFDIPKKLISLTVVTSQCIKCSMKIQNSTSQLLTKER
jgi:hypothetical protein